MKLFGMILFQSKKHKKPIKERLKKMIELGIKSLIIILVPAFSSTLFVSLWYVIFFRYERSFDGGSEGIIIGGLIAFAGLLYCLLTAVIFNTVWGEYKQIRCAVKRYDVETFVDLVDEEISPLVYTILCVSSLSVIGGFMLLDYQNAIYGIVIVGTISYLLSLILFIIIEIDDPCSGVWFIKNIPPEWLAIDAHRWRKERIKEPSLRLKEKISACAS
jgi:hypothetical protein